VESGKVKSYLLYAIGEIILVVVGILLALQINNWNEAKKDRQLEEISYCKLLEDVAQDHVLLKKLMDEDQDRIRWVNQSIYLLQQKDVNRGELANAMRNSINLIRFNFKPSLSAFDDLKSSGKLGILRDLELKNKLLNYYAVMAGYGDIQDIVADASLEVYMHPTKDLLEAGFSQIDFLKTEMDTSKIDVSKLSKKTPMTDQTREKFLNESILHLNTNARKKAVFKLMESEILAMKDILENKCNPIN
jgi:hypothetical protein